jgi:hypothetical protein
MLRNLKGLTKQNRVLAKRKWLGEFRGPRLHGLDALSQEYRFSIALGDLIFLEDKWYVTHAGLLRLAHRTQCAGIRVQQIREFCDPSVGRWVFKATVYKSPRSKGFVGYGDADPSNVSPLVHGAEMRAAETRAVNRALRKAYGIGLCSVEELGWLSRAPYSSDDHARSHKPCTPNGSNTGQPRLRDHLCLLIRQYNLDPKLVKAYAAEFCGTQSLKEASRDLVESFITHLAEWAARDRSGLLCKLNSFAPSQEVHS